MKSFVQPDVEKNIPSLVCSVEGGCWDEFQDELLGLLFAGRCINTAIGFNTLIVCHRFHRLRGINQPLDT